MTNVQVVWPIAADLGEGPLWVARESALYWVDINNNCVYRYSPADGDKQTYIFDDLVSSLAIRRTGGFVGTIRNGFATINLESRTVVPIALPEADVPGNRFNDGKVDSHGRYWAGSKDNDERSGTGALYRLDGDLSLSMMDDDYIITNGPAFSVDGRTMYHTDSIKRVVYAFDCDDSGAISNKRPFIHLQHKAEGVPDGMTVDSEDCLWLCHFGGARLTRYSPDGVVMQIVPMPVPNVTSCTFGGANLDTLYITTARITLSEEQLAAHPLSGSLFACQPGATGLPTPMFAG